MTSFAAATPRPWNVVAGCQSDYPFVMSGKVVVSRPTDVDRRRAEANAALIVRSVNGYERLQDDVKRLREVLDRFGFGETVDARREVLALKEACE